MEDYEGHIQGWNMFKKFSLVLALTLVGKMGFAAGTAPDRFLPVDAGKVYRGAFIDTEAKMEYLKSKGVKTVVSMITDQVVSASEQKWADKYGIKLVWVPVDGFKGPNDAQTKVIQQWLNAKDQQPVYIHCTHGRDRTGVEIGLYRVWTDGWTAHKAYKEMKALGFRNILLPMTRYYKRVSGFEAEEKAGIND